MKSRRYYRKSYLVEAVQFVVKEHEADTVACFFEVEDEKPHWYRNAIHRIVLRPYKRPLMVLGTRDGTADVYEGDWVIRDENGNISVCKPNLFKTTYNRSAGR